MYVGVNTNFYIANEYTGHMSRRPFYTERNGLSDRYHLTPPPKDRLYAMHTGTVFSSFTTTLHWSFSLESKMKK